MVELMVNLDCNVKQDKIWLYMCSPAGITSVAETSNAPQLPAYGCADKCDSRLQLGVTNAILF